MDQQTELQDALRAAGLIDETPSTTIELDVENIPEELVLDAGDVGTDGTIEEIVGEHALSDEDGEEINSALAVEDLRQEAYESATSTVTLKEDGLEATAEQTPINPKKARAPKGSKTPKVKTGAAPGKRVSRVTTFGSLAKAGASVSGNPDDEALISGLAKKVQEKAVNFLQHEAKGSKLSIFTELAVKELGTQGRISSKRLVELFQSPSSNGRAGYSVGTARSQAQQQMTVLTALGLCEKQGTELLTTGKTDRGAKFWGPRTVIA